jgi:hypothetical protein
MPLANVRIVWSESSRSMFNQPMEILQESTSRLLLELVAVRDIEEGEEILLDYGDAWQATWDEHVNDWEERKRVRAVLMETLSSAYSMNEMTTKSIRTLAEQKQTPYPDNVFTSCYYKFYSQDSTGNFDIPTSKHTVTRAEWQQSSDSYENRHLRPCLILDRHVDAKGGSDVQHDDDDDQELRQHYYTIRIMNRPGLRESERIPHNVHHIVSNVPRDAIQFSDKLYTTDQHIETAFRHHIGLVGNDLFPPQWMDLIGDGR